jgi:hypothetical protein
MKYKYIPPRCESKNKFVLCTGSIVSFNLMSYSLRSSGGF